MNYLGHIYFSYNDPELMLANLYGDFFKGSKFEILPEKIAEGVRLHRSIDFYVDNHPAVKKILPDLRIELPKIAPIAIDLFFDHLLAKNWIKFHPVPLPDFLTQCYSAFSSLNPFYPEEFKIFISKMIQYDWMSVYHTTDGLNKMCHGVGRKIAFDNKLHLGLQTFKHFEKEIEFAFHEYMNDANEYFTR